MGSVGHETNGGPRRCAPHARRVRAGALGAALVASVTMGCATAYTLSTDWTDQPCGTKPTLRWPYSGMQWDVVHGRSSAFALFDYLDLPLSLVADTLVLPYTIPQQADSGNLSDSCPGVTPSWSG